MADGGFWDALGAREQRKLAALATRRGFRRGDVLCREGDRSTTVLVLRTGTVRIVQDSSDGRELVVAVRSAGDIIGELAAVDNRPRSATMEALEDGTALELPGPRLFALCEREPQIAWALLVVLAARLRDTGRQRVDVGGGAITRRVAAQLLQLAMHHGVQHGDDVEIAVPATQQELATTAAISRESWARITRELRRQGVISTGRRRVTIHRMAELRRLAR